MWEEREKFRKKLLNRKEIGLEDLENSQPIHEKVCYGVNSKGLAGQVAPERDYGCDSWIKAAILAEARDRDGVIAAETLPTWTKGTGTEQNEGMLLDLLDCKTEQ